jgi:hypothetical protein
MKEIREEFIQKSFDLLEPMEICDSYNMGCAYSRYLFNEFDDKYEFRDCTKGIDCGGDPMDCPYFPEVVYEFAEVLQDNDS